MLTNLRLADLRLTTVQQRSTGQNLPSDIYLPTHRNKEKYSCVRFILTEVLDKETLYLPHEARNKYEYPFGGHTCISLISPEMS
jgi:hypothetical protein